MTTQAVRAGTPVVSSRPSGLTGTGFLLRFMLRRDMVRLMIPTLALLVFCVYYVTATAALYPTAADRLNRAASISNAGGVLLSGPSYGLTDYTTGAMFANEMALWIMVFLAMTNIFQITRNTRAEEETGRAELVRSLPVGRHAATVAALLVVVIVDVVFGVLGGALISTVGGLAAPDTFALMTGVVLTGLVFAAVATVTCQLTVYGRGASGMAFAVVGAAALIRGLGDIQQPHGSWLSWLSPIAWTQQMRPYVDLRLWPLGLSVLAIIVALAVAAVLAGRRDLGEGMVHERRGRTGATPSLASPFALAFRQLRTALLCWLVGCVVMFGLSGAFLGKDVGQIANALAAQNSLTAKIFAGDPLGAFLRIFILHCALAMAGFSVAAVLRVKAEEEEGRLGLELSRPVSRNSLLISRLTVVTLGMLALMLIGGGVALWAGSLLSQGQIGLGEMVGCAATFAPAIAVLITFAAACYAWFPRATPLAWILFAIVVVQSFFGQLLGLPDALSALSPFWWVGNYPVTPVAPSHMIGLCAAAAVLLALAVAGFRRRDLSAA
jgi:ABC-2 type transport system permease protein